MEEKASVPEGAIRFSPEGRVKVGGGGRMKEVVRGRRRRARVNFIVGVLETVSG